MPSNAVFPMPLAFGICLIFNAIGIADAVTSIIGAMPAAEMKWMMMGPDHLYANEVEEFQ